MNKHLTCIECPKSCQMAITIQGDHVFKVEGNLCPKGKVYAQQEIEDPRRIVTMTVVARCLPLKVIPVRTDRSIPKSKVLEVVQEIQKMAIDKPVKIGDVVIKDLLGLGVQVVVTRDAIE